MSANSCDPIYPRQMRKIKPTRRSVSGIYSFRGEVPIPYESTLERDFLIKMEFSLSVLSVVPQPIEVPFELEGGAYVYTPDFFVSYRQIESALLDYSRPILVEVKPSEEWRKNWRAWSKKWKAALRIARSQGWEFHIYDESRIRDKALENIRFLDPYKRMQFAAEETQWILANLAAMGSAPVHFLLARHFMGEYRAAGIAHIWHLLATRQIDCDINLPLNERTELWVPL